MGLSATTEALLFVLIVRFSPVKNPDLRGVFWAALALDTCPSEELLSSTEGVYLHSHLPPQFQASQNTSCLLEDYCRRMTLNPSKASLISMLPNGQSMQ